MFWRLLIPLVSVIGFAYTVKARKEAKARTIVEDALKYGKTPKEFAGAARIAHKYGWNSLARELLEKAKAAAP